jgi:hypothetical protein
MEDLSVSIPTPSRRGRKGRVLSFEATVTAPTLFEMTRKRAMHDWLGWSQAERRQARKFRSIPGKEQRKVP